MISDKIFSILIVVTFIVISLGVITLTPYWVNGGEPQYTDKVNKVSSIIVWSTYLISAFIWLVEVIFDRVIFSDNILQWSLFGFFFSILLLILGLIEGTIYTPLEIASALYLVPFYYNIKNLFTDITLIEWLLLGIFLALVFICLRLFKLDKTKYRD